MDLKERFGKFEKDSYPSMAELFKRLVEEGQKPGMMIISCADSRVVPELVTSSLPGDIFVIRNIANMVPPYDSVFSSVPSAVDYAVGHLKVSKLVVLGHSQCGGVKALLEVGMEGHLGKWLELGREVLEQLESREFSSFEERQRAAEMVNVEVQLARLKGYPCVQKALERGELVLEGWYYQLVPPSLLPVALWKS
ncbi:MAG TPA: carbonic anhydrase [Thermosulfidibacter takaii]|uniref:carbonic anhydrase n=1 Tax=Thermosulfidibacter takaii TaxID=412593 RepID=A0A7C0U648_9BACT|nr:carbonic anhydrase [Thermosulfidibacter takaii]